MVRRGKIHALVQAQIGKDRKEPDEIGDKGHFGEGM